METEKSYPVHDCSTHCFGLFHNGEFIRTGELGELKAEGIRMTGKDGKSSSLTTLTFSEEGCTTKQETPLLLITKQGDTVFVISEL